MNKWFLFIDGVETDSYTLEQIRQMYEKHLVDGETLTRRSTSPEWISLEKDSELAAFLDKKTKPSALPVVEAVPDSNPDQIRLSCPVCGQHYVLSKDIASGTRLQCQKCSACFSLKAPAYNPKMTGKTPFYSSFSSPKPERERKENVDFSEKTIEGDITCPHCWKTFSAGDVLYISMHPDLLGDSLLGADAQKRFIPTIYNSQGIPLDEYEMACTDTACPHCHLQIPSSILDMGSLYFSIVGAPSSGKSYFLTSLVHQLRKTLPEYADYSFSDVDPRINKTLNVYENEMFMAVDKNKVVTLAKTEEVGMDFSDQTILNGLPVFLPKPFIFQSVPLTNESGDRMRKNIIFYDNAGEHFEPGREKVSNPATLHLAHSDAIIFIFDPLNDAEMRSFCNPSDPQMEDVSKVSNQTVLFSEMVSRIRRHANMTIRQKSQIPLILAVGKYDTWEHKFNEKIRDISPFEFNDKSCEMEFDPDILYSVSFSLREFMLQYAPGIVSQAETFFETVLFVPVSSFGTFAEASGGEDGRGGAVGIVPAKLAPVWVDVPFYAVVYQLGALHEKKHEKKNAVLLDVRKTEDKLVFAHPVAHHRVQLPLHYAGRCLRIAGKQYQIPAVSQNKPLQKTNTADYWA